MRAAEKYARGKNLEKDKIRRKIPKEIRYSLNKIETKPKCQNQRITKIQRTKMKKNDALKHVPKHLKYLLESKESLFNIKSLKNEKKDLASNGFIEIPENFSIIDNPDESYKILKKIIYALLIEDQYEIVLDYKICNNIELSTQVFFDIILKEFKYFRKICSTHFQLRFPNFRCININNEDIKKMFWSVGTPAILDNRDIKFTDIEKCPLRSYDKSKSEEGYSVDQKEFDVTELTDYVVDSLKRINKKLTPQKLDDLCTIIGEILINAEEHSYPHNRFSIGYFREKTEDGKHYGIFRLVILNLGKTIYQKFKSDDCPNKNIVARMNALSQRYTKRLLFFSGEFEEENLWTLYALQEGVSSVSPIEYNKRGNGSIRFIERFFNIKGNNESDSKSKLTILSGSTQITFDGKYKIQEKTNTKGETNKVMTFNDSGNIEDKPDTNYVRKSKYYFPGTMISVKLLLNDDDVKLIN